MTVWVKESKADNYLVQSTIWTNFGSIKSVTKVLFDCITLPKILR